MAKNADSVAVLCLDADTTRYMTPEAELEDAELGDRVTWWLVMCDFASVYATQQERERSMTLVLVGQVAEATSHRGRAFPREWWPTDVEWPAPNDGSGVTKEEATDA